MLALEVEYLMGRVIASSHDDRKQVEWPPHPGRLFASLVAAYKECDLSNAVRHALQWFEELPEPLIYADPPHVHGIGRDVHETFVPVNDPKKNSKSILPDSRSRQPRCFPAITPAENIVYFIWPNTNPDKSIEQALQEVAEQVSYLGHSMSPVRVSVKREIPANKQPTLIPDPKGTLQLRTTAKGRLEYLENLHQLRIQNASLQPKLGRVRPYRIAGEPEVVVPQSLYQHIYILRKTQGCRLPVETSMGVCSLVRKALMGLCGDPLPESICGHQANNEATVQPHMTVIPLVNSGHQHADGHIMGIAVLFPTTAPSNERRHLEKGLMQLKELTLGFLGTWTVKLESVEQLPSLAKALQPTTYSAKSQHWATVTPIVFGHHPKKQTGKDAIAVLGQNCLDIGLPMPCSVNILPASRFRGVPKAGEFKHNEDYRRAAHLQNKLLAHVELSFEHEVCGPVILGMGRFLGLGLCRPYRSAKEVQDAE